MAGIQNLNRGLQPRFQLALQALGRRFLIADEQALHVGITQDDSAPARPEIGLGTAQAPGVRGLHRALDDLGTGALQEIVDLGRVENLEVRLDLALDRKVPNPDRADVRAKAVGAAGFVGLEDLAGQENGPVEVSPADEGMVGVELGESQAGAAWLEDIRRTSPPATAARLPRRRAASAASRLRSRCDRA